MSDEFIVLATKEIHEELLNLENILNSCENNDDVYVKSDEFQKSTHKIKGLAPMMGKEELGKLSSLLDNMLKKAIEGQKTEGIFDILTESIQLMKNSMNESNYDLSSMFGKLKHFSSNP